MNIYEKVIFVFIGIAIVVISIFTYTELEENSYQEIIEGETSDFDRSFGDEFKIGNFTTVVNSTSSSAVEENCSLQTPVMISVLHDAKEDIETFLGSLFEGEEDFQVNQNTIDLFCHKTAKITLINNEGEYLTLTKVPFIRKVPEGGNFDDVGTLIQIDTVIVSPEEGVSEQFTNSNTMLIPDKFLVE